MDEEDYQRLTRMADAMLKLAEKVKAIEDHLKLATVTNNNNQDYLLSRIEELQERINKVDEFLTPPSFRGMN